MKKTSLLCIMTILALVLTSCGAAPTLRELTSDDASANVDAGATNVSLDKVFSIEFGKSMNVSTVNSSSYFVVPTTSEASLSLASIIKAVVNPTICNPANAISATVTNTSSGSRCDTSFTLTPAAALSPSTSYALCATGNIQTCNPNVDGIFDGSMVEFTTAGGGDTYTVGGTLSDLPADSTVVLQNNEGDDLSLIADGSFTFATALADGATYNVQVLTSPAGYTCTASSNTGTVASANVTSVVVTCSSQSFSVGGSLTGLGSESVTVQLNGGDDQQLSEDGAFTFSEEAASGSEYTVTVESATRPCFQTCTVSNGTGTVTADVTDVTVTCVDKAFVPVATLEDSFTVAAGTDFGNSNNYFPVIGIAGDDTAILSWGSQNTLGPEVFANYLYPATYNGSLWSYPDYDTGYKSFVNKDVNPMDMDVNASGTAIVAWRSTDSPDLDNGVIYTRIYSDGSWSAADRRSPPDTAAQYSPVVVDMNDSGEAVVVWAQASNDDPYPCEIFASVYDGTSWVDPADGTDFISDSVGDGPIEAFAVINADGLAMAIWDERYNTDNDYRKIYAGIYNIEDAVPAWSDPGVLVSATDSVIASDVSVAMDDNGSAVAVWQEATDLGDFVFEYKLWRNAYAAGVWGTASQIDFDDTSPYPLVDTATGNKFVSLSPSGDYGVIGWVSTEDTPAPSYVCIGDKKPANEELDKWHFPSALTGCIEQVGGMSSVMDVAAVDTAVNNGGYMIATWWGSFSGESSYLFESEYTIDGWFDPASNADAISPPSGGPSADATRVNTNSWCNASIVWSQQDSEDMDSKSQIYKSDNH